MNQIALWFASGESLYAGAFSLLALIAISPSLLRNWSLRLRNLAAWLALAMMIMACPPFSWSVDVIFLSTFILWFVMVNQRRSNHSHAKPRMTWTVVFAILLVTLAVSELSRRSMPVITGAPRDHLVVIGDSISSGIDARVAAWPVVMQQVTGVPVKNLAQPGAETIEAAAIADKVTREDELVLIEIGGNDLLSGVPPEKFGQALEATLAKLVAPGRMVVMFELPLLPHRIAFGQIQRRLAAKYGVVLIPKRFFVEVIGGANATTDGLHLSEAGTHSMATLVAKALSRVLKPKVQNIPTRL